MKCPVCNTEIDDHAISCSHCGAHKRTGRTNLGIFVAWAGMTIGVMFAMLWAGLLILPFTDHGLYDFPWKTLIIGTAISIGMLWYSRKTVHTKWERRED